MHNLKHCCTALLICLLLAVYGCAEVTPVLKQSSETLEQQASTRAAQQDYASAARLYQLAGEAAQEPRRSSLLLEGAQAAAQADNPSLSRQLLNAINSQSLGAHAQAQFKLLQLQARIAGQPPARALALLPPPDTNTPPDIAAKTWSLRAELFFANNQLAEGVHALVQRAIWLVDPEQVKANDYDIWNRLRKQLPAAGTRAADSDKVTAGWIELAQIGGKTWPDRKALESALRSWEIGHPGHPATRHILPERFDYQPTLAGSDAAAIALALPLTGNFSSAAAAIQDGFLAGYYAAGNTALPGSSAPRPNLRIYDTNTLSNANNLLERARADGVSTLVGPLQKDIVTDLARRSDLGMPVLALNYIDSKTVPPDFYQFGLAPEDEARAAAERALAMGWRTAIALVPEGGWGARVLDAFRNAFNSGGGSLIDYANFDTHANDHAAPIKRVLRYGQANAAPQAVDTANGENTSLRRQDTDLIFIAAQPEQARQIRTQLRFFHASRLPVLATSHVYSGTVNRSNDGDLEGLMFADMPWVLGGSSEIQARRAQAQKVWPRADRQYPRLFAMGYDAWLLVERLSTHNLQPGTAVRGNTGNLMLEPGGEIHRSLDWAQFRNGVPQPLAPAQPTALPRPVSY